MYTLIDTAKLNDVDSQAWLADVRDRVADLLHYRLNEFLPWHWKAGRQHSLAALLAVSTRALPSVPTRE